MAVVVAVQVYAQGFKPGERLLPFGTEFVAFVAQVYPRSAAVGVCVCIIVVVEAAAHARIVVIDVFFGQQADKAVRAFVNQALLLYDVGVVIIVFRGCGQADDIVFDCRSYCYADKPFSPTQDSLMLPVWRNRRGCRAGVSDCGNAVRRNPSIAVQPFPCAIQSFCPNRY